MNYFTTQLPKLSFNFTYTHLLSSVAQTLKKYTQCCLKATDVPILLFVMNFIEIGGKCLLSK